MHKLLLLFVAGLLAINLAPVQGAENMTGLKSHPCVLVNAQSLAALRAKAADERLNRFGFKTAEVWQSIKAKADRFAALPTYSYAVDIPGEGRVVLEHWSYTLSDQTPPPHPNSPSYPPWTAMFQERDDSLTTRLVHFSFAYLVTGDDLYFQKAKEIAMHLSHWANWTDRSYGSAKCCLDTGHCMYAVGMFYDWCFDRLSDAERAQVRNAIINNGILPSLEDVDRYPSDTNGYAVITAGMGLAALAIRPEEPRADEWLQACIDKTRVSLDHGGKDGGMFEGPMYGTYLIDSFALLLDGLNSAQVQHDLFQHPYLKTMDRYCIGLLAPDTNQIPCFSDGSPGTAVPKLQSILAQQGSSDAAWYLQRIDAVKPETIYDFIRFDESKLHPAQPPWNPSVALLDIGYASLRDGFNANAATLFFKSGPYANNIGHNHFDHNSFVISYARQWIIPDRGYHDFYIAARRKFSEGTIGHCSVVLDVDDAYMHDQTSPAPGHDQVTRAKGRIADFFGGKYYDFVKGSAAEAYNTDTLKVLDQFDRSIVYLKPDVFVIYDQLAAPQPHSYNFLLHTDGNGEIAQQDNVFTVTRGNAQVWAQSWSPANLTPHIETYPGAEGYGSYLRLETGRTPATTILTALYPRPYQAENYLRNGGFEKGMGGWSPRANEDLPNHKIVTDNPAEGTQCATIINSGYYYSEKFGIPVGTNITVKGLFRTTPLQAGKGATMTLLFWKGGKAFDVKRVGPFADEQWTEHEVIGKVPEGTEEVSVALEFMTPGQAWFDNVRLTTDAKVAPPLTPQFRPLSTSALDVTVGADHFLVSFGESGKARQVEGLRTDAEVAVVSLNAAGRPERVLIKNGTFLELGGQSLAKYAQLTTAELDLSVK